ncbi:MAG: NTE family protein [Porticoccaceae bacterium]|jgi:NTE family protein|tara:strand:+ start:3012 stop:3890 length:879 start_codon:yes stop_codon:yes gene_type:complete
MFKKLFNTTIGLALGGGAAKGVAHIGVLKALEDADIEVDYIAGTSVGAMIAALYAFKVDVETIGSLARRLTMSKVTSFKLNKTGFFSTESLRELMLEYVGDVAIEDAAIPLSIVATDINSGEEIILTSGSVVDAVCASAAIPGIYIPVEINGRTLVDGGLVQNVPIEALQTAGAGVTIASHLNSVSHYQEISHVLDVMRNAFEIAVSQHTQDQLKEADLLISMDLSDFSLRDNTERYDELFNIGHQAATVQLTKLAWYKKTNVFLYIGRMMRELAPFKLPEFIRRALNKTGV